ncbi:dihydrolipoamide acetyltransferase family protein, partial [Cryptosporangium minutisporangium]|uniref:dihydrolipoamide acetyltransferase family protein n=1 Tax=Cryptosporangium minutisporangium TaxID=113569 RepID=UPI0035EEC04C
TDPGPAADPGPATDPRPDSAPGPSAAPAPEAGGGRRVALSGVGKAAAAAFTRSRREIPEATIWVDVDATPLVALRERTEPGLLAYLARFTVAALREFPVFNSRYDAERQEIVHLDRINLGIAVQGARGLVVPAVVGAETLTTTELGVGIRRVVAAARAGTSTPAELTAGTFTLNDYGVFDVDGGAPILNPPQVAMLGVGRIIDRPWVVEGAVVVRKVAQLSFVFDHRVCDGETASRFLRRVADAVENPAAALAHL